MSRTTLRGRRSVHGLSVVGLIGLAGFVAGPSAAMARAGLPRALVTAGATASSTASGTTFSASRVLTRTHVVDGKDVEVDRRTFALTVGSTAGLRDRQGVQLSWTGAHPSGGIVFDDKKPHAADEEYPVVVLQCRGTDSPSSPASQRVSRQTCFTGTWDTRYYPPYRGTFPAPRVDRYASPAERTASVGAPTPQPASCVRGVGYSRYVPFLAADGTRYYGGSLGCAGLAPEQTVIPNPLNPASATWARTLSDGTGSTRFIVQDDQDNASLGCSAAVACSLVVVPIVGISCDVAAAGLPASDKPPTNDAETVRKECETQGAYTPGTSNGDQKAADPISKYAVNGRLWWSASNWRNRISVPITFAKTAASCGLTSGGTTPLNVFGSQVLAQAVQQWAPSFCSNPALFPLQQTETAEVQAKNLLATGVTNSTYLGVQGIYQAGPPSTPFANPVVQAPTAISGWGIGFVVDNRQGKQVTHLRLNARLLAKLLSMSYPATGGARSDWATSPAWSSYRPASHNPLNMGEDPEFKALNPELADLNNIPTWSSTTLFSLSSDTDVITALTSYLQADPEARAWLDGTPDPWGMKVNPNYVHLQLPVTSWPLLDRYVSPVGSCAGQNEPIFPLVAGQVSSPTQLSFNLQYGISNSLINCVQVGDTVNDVRRQSEGPEDPGTRFVLGVVSLADAARFGIAVADLQTQVDRSAPAQPVDTTGRSFVTADDAGLLAAAKLLEPNDTLGTWTLPYAALHATTGRGAYPGMLLVSTDVPTKGLDATTASKFASLLRFVAGAGQVRGPLNGQLANGYLPLTSQGLSVFAVYTRNAAAAVLAQDAFVPKPSAPSTGPPAKVSAPSTSSNPGSGTSGPASQPGGSSGAGSPPSGGTSGSSPTASGGTRVSPTLRRSANGPVIAPSRPIPIVDLSSPGRTAAAVLAWSSSALAVLILLAFGCSVLGLWTSGVLAKMARRRP